MNLTLHYLRCLVLLIALQLLLSEAGLTQDCSGLTATFTAAESRCTATGTLQIHASGGSGNYNYKAQGTVAASYTSSSLIAGLAPGNYSLFVKDIVSNCEFEIDSVVISGTYSDPRFGITETDVTCSNGNDGSISVAGLSNGRSPFVFTIVSPSPAGIGTSNGTGQFSGLIPGTYSIQLADSCGGIQTRTISIQNYTWSIASAAVTQTNCTAYHAQLNLLDSKGNTSGAAFSGFQYGFVNAPGDTSWFATSSFDFDLAQHRSITLVAKDRCGLVNTKTWTNPLIPSVQANAVISALSCTGFTASVTGQQNLTSPTFCLLDNGGNPVSGQPCNASGIFSNIPYGAYCIQLTNTCYDTVITRCFSQAQALPTVTGAVAMSNYTCTGFKATVTGQHNLTSPQYCLYDGSGNAVTSVPCNNNGVFDNLPYGSYSIRVEDGCTHAYIFVNFTGVQPIRSVAATITTNGFTCSTFNASVTGQTNLTSPVYCLVDHLGNPVTGYPCNSTGIFTNLPYGDYCINITDGCNDTSFQRCISMVAPVPMGGAATISNKTCSGFTVTITGQTNVFNGQYCLQDSLGNPVTGIPCNSTGIFTNVPYGSYCVKTTDGCSGNLLTNCFTVAAPTPAVGPVVISNKTCAGFTATLSGQQQLTSPSFCLFDSAGNAIGACNGTGVFAITTFGAYYITTTDGCAGTIFNTPFSIAKLVSAVAPVVTISNQTCTDFTATVNGQTNLTNPHYYLKDSVGNPVSDNLTGAFPGLSYGSYCIDVVNGCMDTTITRCFTAAPNPTQLILTATPSCSFGNSDLVVQVTTGFAPYTVMVFDPSDNQLATTTSSSNHISISALPGLAPGAQYRVLVTAACGLPANQYVTAVPSSLSHTYSITPKCPSSITLNGSGDLLVSATTNLGTLAMTIIQKNNLPDTIGYSFRAGNDFTFSNLDAATYVIAYSFSGCSIVINDTIALPDYSFPSLSQSGAYQCDNNSFSVGASVSGGMGPFTYQVIGSAPSTPSINTSAQASPVFTINNGVQYSLVRLRAIDACGNAALNDVSIQPLANTITTASKNCIYQGSVLSIDVIPNATYTWYKKSDGSSTDSVMVGTGPTYTIPAIAVSDTGVYVNRMTVNSGCLTRLSYVHIDGMCNGAFTLPGAVILTGKMMTASVSELNWIEPAGLNTMVFVIERANNGTGQFETVGTVSGSGSSVATPYHFTDNVDGAGNYLYRLKIVSIDNAIVYTNTVLLKTSPDDAISVFPNPVKDEINITVPLNTEARYSINLVNVAGQVVFRGLPLPQAGGLSRHPRDANIKAGIYFLQVQDMRTGTGKVFKLKFE